MDLLTPAILPTLLQIYLNEGDPMIIDNVFNIKTYLGSQALPLVNPPASLASDATYVAFVNNISSVYATQAINGSIPYMYKTGNVIDVNSSLKALEPKQSYYFVSKSTASFPYNVPYSGLLMPFTSYGNCPVVNLASDMVTLTSTSGNYHYSNQNITNLNIGENYQYDFRVVDNNWPVTIIPSSGNLQSSQSINNIGAMIRFDSDVGVTDYSTFLPPRATISQIDKKNLFAIIEVSVTAPTNLGCPKVLDTFMIRCDNCIPIPSPTPTATPTPTPTPAPVFADSLIVTGGATQYGGGLSFAATNSDRLQVTFLTTIDGTATTMNLKIGGVGYASVGFPSNYLGRSFRYTRAATGLSYLGTFAGGDIFLA